MGGNGVICKILIYYTGMFKFICCVVHVIVVVGVVCKTLKYTCVYAIPYRP